MSVTRIASRYAKSLLDLAQDQDKVDAVVEDVQSFLKTTDHRGFYLLLKSPIVKATKKLDIIKAIFDGKISELTMAFLNIVVKKGREAYLPEIATEFIKQYKKQQKISTVQLTTAQELSEEGLNEIKKKLLASNITEDSVEIQTFVDEALIGGFVAKVGDKLIDASVAHKLRNMAKTIAK